MFLATTPWCLLFLLSSTFAESWRWPDSSLRESRADTASSVRIDTKVRFVDQDDKNNNNFNKFNNNIQSDEGSFQPQGSDVESFYSRPLSYRQGSNRYPSSTYRPPSDSDGTLDSLEQCKCVSTPECNPRPDPHNACKSGQYLCCYRRPNKSSIQIKNSEYLNEIENDSPRPFNGRPGAPFLPNGFENVGINQNPFLGNNIRPSNKPGVLVGPNGPTGQVGPPKTAVLVGPEGPTGHIGPGPQQNEKFTGPNKGLGPQQNPGILVGPEGPTGIIGPNIESQKQQVFDGGFETSGSAQRGVLVGPGGPTGIIGPYNQQRPVLVGPGGPTGIIGPNRGFNRGGYNRGVLVGPGGPTGIIGPAGYGRQLGPGILVGPGGSTGQIGPARGLLVGPGGPTGQIGPRGYFF